MSDVHGPHDFDVVADAAGIGYRKREMPSIMGPPIHTTTFEERKNEPGLRYDKDKPRYDLIPPEALEALANVYTKGAAKYSDRNWEKGMSWGRCFGSLMRHCWKWWAGEEVDIETGCHHMAMAAWNCFALYTYVARGIGTDDRGGPE